MATTELAQEVVAGRELDAEVARRVMGLYDVTVTPSGSLCHDPGKGEWCVAGSKYHLVPNYSTDMSDAWKVVEALAGCGLWMTLLTPYGPTDGYHVNFTPHGEPEWRECVAKAIAETPALAICRAALKAVESSQHPGARAAGEK